MSTFSITMDDQDLCIHGLFETQIEQLYLRGLQTSDVVAVVFEDKQLTYYELNCRANQLAHYLQSVGVGPEVLVGIYVERSLEMVVGLLGILKAGGAYVPLDPAYPPERLAFMLEDAQVPIVLTQEHLVQSLPESQTPIICLDRDWEAIAQHNKENPTSEVTPDNVAYTIYTSGSTGKPKGVQIPHRAVVNFLNSMRLSPGLTEQDILLAVTTITFDIAALELFLPLIVGARVAIASREVASDGVKLSRALLASGATVMQATPATWQLLLQAGWQGNQQLKILCGGEALPQKLADQLVECCASVWNLYGPTETTIWSTVCKLDYGDRSTCIGHPIANTQLYLLDDRLQPVPIGVPGELYIGGAGLAIGYLNRPDLTAERFISNPFSNEPNSRLYKTGDLVRTLSDGNIEYIGRIDHQVKIRGFRIELGEIEAALYKHPAVLRAVVIAREDIPGDKRLVAYIVSNLIPDVISEPSLVSTEFNGISALVGDLRSFLKQKLPAYMMPSNFVFLNSFPLTPNGKLDRKALPAPSSIKHELEEDFAAPRTPIEEELARIWCEVLRVERVGIYDNFLELGGHSLLATQIISRVRDSYQVELPVRHLFEQPTIAELAELIEAARLQGDVQAGLIQPTARDRNLPLSFAQERLWFLDQLVPENPFYNVIEAFRLTGTLDLAVLEQSFQEIIRRHETLRTNFTTVDGQPVQIIQDPPDFKLSVVNLQGLPKTERENQAQQLATKEAQQLFDLTQGSLLRVTLLQLDEQEYILVINLHHILCDDWSSGVLFKELTALYKAFSTGKPSPLPALPIQYADFATWQRQWLQGNVQQEQLAYWQKQLADLPILQLPTDRPRPATPSYRGALHSLALPKTLTAALKALSQKEGVTLFMTLLAAFQTLLYRYTGSEDIPVGAAIANRHLPDVDKLIGFFANTVVLRTDVSGSPSFKELLARVREVALGAYAHQDLPFEKLVAELHSERDLSRQSLFQVVLSLQNAAPSEDLQLPGLKATYLTIDNKTAKFDLFLQLSDTAEGLTGWIEYSTDLFEDATISRMVGHFKTLLEGIVANPQQAISDLPLLTEAERHQLLIEWNDTEANYPQDVCIHQLFEERVKETPDAVAVVFEDEQLTYRELNCRANQLAHHLQILGVQPEVLVAICVERSLEMVVGTLGILKAGGAYVPLDPKWPTERIEWILSTLNISCIVTQSLQLKKLDELQWKLPKLTDVICLDVNTPELSPNPAKQQKKVWTNWNFQQLPDSNLSPSATSDNTAYIIHTSGSTGVPKGVVVRHQPAVNLIDWVNKTFRVGASDRVLFTTSLCFDLSVYDIFGLLASGGSIRVASRHELQEPKQLVNLLCSGSITFWDSAPAALQQLVPFFPTKDANEKSRLRLVFLSGDWIPVTLPDALKTVFPQVEVISLGGATEATIWSNYYPIGKVDPQWTSIPYGKPIQNAHYHILDAHLNPCPIGVCGELYIGGSCLASGYTDPVQTAAKFIPDVFSSEPQARLYKTGDLARYRPDGNIEFLGRIDHQVKIRGFRVELGEIQSVLSQHPAVEVTAVIDREDVTGQKQLVAYVVPNQQDEKALDQQADSDTEYVSQWQTLYEETYSQTAAHEDPTFNIIGWNSSYTGLPIPEVEMREWVDNTVERILSLQPSRVLEIGCGTGLLLSRIAPHCSQYCGMDFSQEAIRYLEQLKRSQPELERVNLLHRTAENFEGIEADSFDTVILNSIVQYFPNIHYLLQVLEGAVKAVRSGGYIFIGDVRSLPLLEAYHASVELYRASDSLTRSQFSQHLKQRMAQEEELVIDPAFFTALKQHLPKINHVQIQLKRGVHYNELTRFRYDVILHVGDEVDPTVDIPWLDWQQENLTLSAIRQLLEETQPEILGLRGVPNARVLEQIKTLEWLASAGQPETVDELRLVTLPQFNKAGVDPEALWSLSQDLPYVIDIGESHSGGSGCYDVVLRHRAIAKAAISPFAEDTIPTKPWHCYANNPLQGKLVQNLIPNLRRFLQQKLPEYMVPSAFVLLDTLPVTPNGKLDRRALPAPETTRVKPQQDFVASRTPMEEQIANLWTKVLGIENIGIDENFFELGGNSLLAAQLIAYIRETLRVEIPVRCLFENPTVQGLAQTIQAIHIEGISALNSTVIDFNAEAVLAPEILPQGTPIHDMNMSEPRHIFLTGATGFVGAYLLQELLEQTQADLYCLVRATDQNQGFQRLQKTLEKYQIWNPNFRSRIIPILGDLDQPRLGLSADKFAELALQIDAIYHNGAQVNFAKPYSTIKAANTRGTEEVLRLACTGKDKPVHYISTCGIYGPVGYFTGTQLIKEEDDIGIAKDYLHMDIGYSQSKWVAEKLAHIAKSRGIPVCIYRLGFVMGHTKTGVGNTADYVSRIVKGCIQVGSYPDFIDQKQEFVPVDYVSKAVVHLSRRKESIGKNFHLSPPPSQNLNFIEFFELISSYGYQLKKLPYTQWKEELIQHTKHSQENALYPLLPMLTEKVYQNSLTILELYQHTPDFDCKNTLEGLTGTDITCPSMNEQLLNTYFSYFIESGFLEPPAKRSGREVVTELELLQPSQVILKSA